MRSSRTPDARPEESTGTQADTSIATRLRWSYLISSTLPLLLVGAVLLNLGWTSQQSSVYDDQENLAQRISRNIVSYLSSLNRQFESFAGSVRPNTTDISQWRLSAQELVTRNYPNLVGLTLLDTQGKELLRVSQLQLVDSSQLRDRHSDPTIVRALQQNQRTFSPVSSPSDTGDSTRTFTVTMPLPNDAGVVIGAIEAEINAETIINELRFSAVENKGQAYIMSSDGSALVLGDSTTTQLSPEIQTLLHATRGVAEYQSAAGHGVVGAFTPINLIANDQEVPTGWTVVVEQPSAIGFAGFRRQILVLALLIVLVGSIALLWAFRQAQEILTPLEQLRIGAETVGSGQLDYRIPLQVDDELGKVAQTFNQMAEHLQQSLAEIESQNDRLRHGLALARDIQMGLLPARAPWSEEAIEVYARSIPAYEVGGDFYSYMALPNGRAAIAIGDISGKGVGAALVMALTSSAVESQARQFDHPAEVLAALNQLLAPRLKANHMNAALLFAVFDPAERTLRVANAGMIAPMILSARGCEFIDIGGLPVGAFAGATYQETVIPLNPGDAVLLLSDGVVEAHNPAGQLFGFEQLEGTLGEMPSESGLQLLVEQILSRVSDFMSGAEQHDDITLVGVRMGRGVISSSDKEHTVDYAII